jgi:hypothetical protein
MKITEQKIGVPERHPLKTLDQFAVRLDVSALAFNNKVGEAHHILFPRHRPFLRKKV